MSATTGLLPIIDAIAPLPSSDGAARQHVVLVRPAQLSSPGAMSSPVTPSLGLAYLAAMLVEAGVSVSAVDALGEAVDQFREEDGYLVQGLSIEETVARIDASATVIGISCMFTQDWPWARRLIRAVRGRFPSALVVAGGEHITALPEFSLRDCPELDLVVLGEGEETIREIALVARDNSAQGRVALRGVPGVASIADGQYVAAPPRRRMREIENLPWPAWDLFPVAGYLDSRNSHGVYRGRTFGILATRGCPYKCTFCSNPVMYGNLWMAREVEDVLDEIQSYIDKYQVENIDFYDLTMITRRHWILDFCRRIDERGMKFTWQLPSGTRSEVIDAEVSAALYRTGCRNVAYAPEKLVDSIRAALGNGIVVRVNLILGFPHDRRKNLWQTLVFAWKLALVGVQDAGVYLFSPYPGTELFDELREKGRIGALDADYFRSLVNYKSFFAPSQYCYAVGGRELAIWRFFMMASFFALSFAVRPWRAWQLVRMLIKNESDTSLQQRLGVLLRRKSKTTPTPSMSA
jgi:radical SAM superfamily enzyme YgiQ (UPF0313 family)